MRALRFHRPSESTEASESPNVRRSQVRVHPYQSRGGRPTNRQRQMPITSTSQLLQSMNGEWSNQGASMLHSAHGVDISGGQFTTVHGPQTTILISTGQQPHSSEPSSSRSDREPSNDENNTSRPPEVPLRGISIPGRLNTSTRTLQGRRGSDIYAQQLLLKKRGFPLWIPGPNGALPMEYRSKGIQIGDVGIIRPEGSFSFLFNICRPADDPINPRVLPEGFSPLIPPLDPSDISQFFELQPKSHLASANIENGTYEASSGFTFWSSASEGAILATPEGAQSRDLENLTGFMQYLIDNIENWYRFANGPRGREARNGDLRLVTGFDKTVSWGMAAFSNTSGASGVAQPTQCQLNFKPTVELEPSICKYAWEYSGLAEVRAGPASEEISPLREEDPNPPRSGKYTNQCVFVRTMNTKLGDERWNKLCREMGTSHLDDNWHLFRNENDFVSRPDPGPLDTPSHSDTSRTRGGSTSTRQRTIQVSFLSDEMATMIPFDTSGDELFVTKPQAAIAFHPADRLNTLLLQKIPNAKMAITQDSAWYLFIDRDTLGLNCEELLEMVLDKNELVEIDGILFLESKLKSEEPPRAFTTRDIPTATSLSTLDASYTNPIAVLGFASTLKEDVNAQLDTVPSMSSPSIIVNTDVNTYLSTHLLPLVPSLSGSGERTAALPSDPNNTTTSEITSPTITLATGDLSSSSSTATPTVSHAIPPSISTTTSPKIYFDPTPIPNDAPTISSTPMSLSSNSTTGDALSSTSYPQPTFLLTSIQPRRTGSSSSGDFLPRITLSNYQNQPFMVNSETGMITPTARSSPSVIMRPPPLPRLNLTMLRPPGGNVSAEGSGLGLSRWTSTSSTTTAVAGNKLSMSRMESKAWLKSMPVLPMEGTGRGVGGYEVDDMEDDDEDEEDEEDECDGESTEVDVDTEEDEDTPSRSSLSSKRNHFDESTDSAPSAPPNQPYFGNPSRPPEQRFFKQPHFPRVDIGRASLDLPLSHPPDESLLIHRHGGLVNISSKLGLISKYPGIYQQASRSMTNVLASAHNALALPFPFPFRRRRSLPTFNAATVPPPYPDFAPHPHSYGPQMGLKILPHKNEGMEKLPHYSNNIYLKAIMPRKMEFTRPGVQARDRKWRRVLCVLEGTSFKVYKCPSGTSGVSAIGKWWGSKVGAGDASVLTPSAFHVGGGVTGASSTSADARPPARNLAARSARNPGNDSPFVREIEFAREGDETRQPDLQRISLVLGPQPLPQPQLYQQPPYPLQTHRSNHPVGHIPKSALNPAVQLISPKSKHSRSNTDSASSPTRSWSPRSSLNIPQTESGQTTPTTVYGSSFRSTSPTMSDSTSLTSLSSSEMCGPSSRPVTPSMRSISATSSPASESIYQPARSTYRVVAGSQARFDGDVRTTSSSSTSGSHFHGKGRDKAKAETPHPEECEMIRAYTMQNAESGLGKDYLKRQHVIRVRLEGEQFLLQAKDVENVILWIEGLQSATNIALDLDERPMPAEPIFPRRRRTYAPSVALSD